MKRLVAATFLMVIGVELLALFLPDRRLIVVFAGIAVALALLAVRWFLIHEDESAAVSTDADDAAKSLRRWLSRTETLVSRAESTRADWDRHLRPMLARQFEMATGQKQTKDRAAFHVTGQMLFGAELWAWVDPENVAPTGRDERGPVAPTGRDERGPGRGALGEILRKLEQI
ncbi:MAG: hypothetical protein JO152_13845 [Mycobacteriaceae bacterium]|nr:hypothetical protein [Mycobacteriaceae bacterium]